MKNAQTTQPLALISGASSGIGLATAKILAREGYSLLLIARREERLLSLKNELETSYKKIKVEIAPLDIRSLSEIKLFTKNYENELKSLTVLINNAGLAKGSEPFNDNTIEDIDLVLDTNVKGLLYLTKMILPFMLQNKQGHIVNLGSVAGRWVYPGGTVYCASKFAVSAITEGLRQDLMGTGLRVTNIEPGMVESEFSLVRFGNQEKADAVYHGMTPLTSADIAETILWCLQRPAHVNIQELVIFPTDQAAIRMVHRTS